MTEEINFEDEHRYPDSYILTVVFKIRRSTISRDYRRHKWKVIRMLVGIDQYNRNTMVTCISWMNRLRNIKSKGNA